MVSLVAEARGAAAARSALAAENAELRRENAFYEGLVAPGLGRMVALHHHSATLYKVHYHIRCLFF